MFQKRSPLFALLCLLSAWTTTGATGCSSDDQRGTPSQSNGAGGAGGTGNVTTGSQASVTSTGSGGGTTTPPINEGFIGGPCSYDDDCDYEGGFCLTDEDGFPDGMCSLDCEKFCPDQDGAVTTFCLDPKSFDASIMNMVPAGLCTTRCDYGASDTGCRQGYQCQPHTRYGDASKTVYSCVPGTDDPFVLGPCHQQLLDEQIPFSPAINPKASPDGHPELICDVTDPIYISPYLGGVTFRPGSIDGEPTSIFTACDHGLSMVDSAEILGKSNVTDLVHWGVYNCRLISGTNKLSEHGYANAIDIAGVKHADGSYFSVLDDWEKGQPNPKLLGGKVLRGFAQTAFDDGVYNIILTPEYNAAHADHLHCDLTPGAQFFK